MKEKQEVKKCLIQSCAGKYNCQAHCPCDCHSTPNTNTKNKKIPLKKMSLFIKCLDCNGVCLNDDDSVCLICGSKLTKRVLVGNSIFSKTY